MADTNIDYFSFIPNVYYQGITELKTSYSDRTLSKNLFRRAKIRPEIFGNAIIFQEYLIQGNQRPDNIAYQVYGDSQLDWLVLLANNIINYYDEWPLSEEELNLYLENKYGTEENINAIRFYRTKEIRDDLNRLIISADLMVDADFKVEYYDASKNLVVVQGTNLLTPVTNYQYESEINNEKQQIFLLRPEYVTNVISDLRQIMQYNDHSEFIDYVTKLAVNVVRV